MSRPIPLSVPLLKGNEIAYLVKCIEAGWVSSAGEFVERFECELARYVTSPHAVATCSGTAALHTALRVLDIGAGDEVIVPTISFIASANVVRYVGAKPVLVGCDKYLNLDANLVEEFCSFECEMRNGQLVNKASGAIVRAVMPVHVFGHPCDMDPIMSVAERFNLLVIEDATESLGSRFIMGTFSGRSPGTIGHLGCFSFNGNKIITSGGGGMIVTSNGAWADRARYLTTQAKDDVLFSIHGDIGYNYRMTNIEAAVGVAQLERLDEFVEVKRKNYIKYRELLSDLGGMHFIDEPLYARSNYWFYSLVLEEQLSISRNLLINTLRENGIDSRPLWLPIHLQPPYEGFQSFKVEKAVKDHERVLNVPCSVSLEDGEIECVCSVIKQHISGRAH